MHPDLDGTSMAQGHSDAHPSGSWPVRQGGAMVDQSSAARDRTRALEPWPAETGPDPRRWRIFAVSLVVGFMALLDVTIVNVAIPSIQEGLDTTTGTVQWVVSGYALTFGLVLVTGGRLGDAYGRRRLMLVGLALFVLTSAAVGLAPSAGLVILARLLQGAAAGLLTPQNSGLIQELFSGAERGRAFGIFGLVVSISAALGPVLGGAIISLVGEDSGWRWIFLVNIPIGLAALVAVARLVPHSVPRTAGEARPRLDPVGSLLLGGGVLCLLYPLVSVEGGQYLWLLLLAAAPVLFAAFVRWERRVVRRGGAPLLDVTLLRRTPGFANGIAVGTLYFTGFTGLVLVLSIHLQTELGLAPFATGLLLTGFAAGSAISAPLAGRVVSTVGRPLTVGALVTVLVAIAAMTALVPGREAGGLWTVLPPLLFLGGLGGGAVISPNFTLTLADVPTRMGGAAGGALQTGQRIGSAVGSALGVTAYTLVLGAAGPAAGLRAAFLTAAAMIFFALVAAVVAVRSERAEQAERDDRAEGGV